jgi:F-type H+-transporting ATPase subunit epsilon
VAGTNLLAVEVVTPERVLISGRASEIMLRTREGDATFLPEHTPLVGTIEPGVVHVVGADGDVQLVAAHGGFVQVELLPVAQGEPDRPRSRATLLLGVAELADEIDVERARAALERAEAKLAELSAAGRPSGPSGTSGTPGGAAGTGEGEAIDPEVMEAEGDLRRAQVRLETVEAPASTGA